MIVNASPWGSTLAATALRFARAASDDGDSLAVYFQGEGVYNAMAGSVDDAGAVRLCAWLGSAGRSAPGFNCCCVRQPPRDAFLTVLPGICRRCSRQPGLAVLAGADGSLRPRREFLCVPGTQPLQGQLRLGLIVRSAPWYGRSGRDQLDLALAAASMGVELLLFFTGPGVLQLLAGQHRAGCRPAGGPEGLEEPAGTDRLPVPGGSAEFTALAGEPWWVTPEPLGLAGLPGAAGQLRPLAGGIAHVPALSPPGKPACTCCWAPRPKPWRPVSAPAMAALIRCCWPTVAWSGWPMPAPSATRRGLWHIAGVGGRLPGARPAGAARPGPCARCAMAGTGARPPPDVELDMSAGLELADGRVLALDEDGLPVELAGLVAGGG